MSPRHMTEGAVDPLAICIAAIHGGARPRAAVFIEETACIGCTLCIQACPVDAIVGAAKQMHTVVAAWCTGCELCLPPCPVDCIRMLPLRERHEDPQAAVDRARRRHEFRLLRKAREQHEKSERLAEKAAGRQLKAAAETRRALISAAVARARELNAR